MVASSNASSGRDRVLPGELVEDLLAACERLAEALLLEPDDALDLLAMLAELRIGVAHLLADDPAEPVDAVEPDPLAVLDGTADDAAADVAATLVRRRDAVGDQERHRAAVVGEHAVRLGRDRVAAVGHPGLGLDPVHDQPEAVGVEDRADVLEQAGAALDAEAGVDVLARQRHELGARPQVVLHEDEVVELHVAVALAAGPAVVAAAAVLWRRGRRRSRSTARTGPVSAACQKLSLPSRTIRSAGIPTRFHASIATVSSPSSSTGLPSWTVAQSRSGSSPMCFVTNSQAQLDGLVLEVVAEREVAEHLEERAVPVGAADVLEVGVLAARAQHLLDADDALSPAARAGRGSTA